MKQRRILILGQSKENSFEIRNLLDDKRFELEIALNKGVGKLILQSRKMDLLVIHTEMVNDDLPEFFEFMEDEGYSLPTVLLGEEAESLRSRIPVLEGELKCFDKPYPVEEMIEYLQNA